MSSWEQETSKVNFDAVGKVNEKISKREGTREGSGYAGAYNTGYDLFGGGNVVGISVDEIPNMKDAIQKYVDAVEQKLEEMNTDADTTEAVKGTGIEQAVKDYIKAVSEYCKALTSQLLAFSDKLTKVQEAWEANDTGVSGTVNASADELSSIGSDKYTAGGK